ncbi:MAG: UvrD-helicase domain-containing protein [Succinivibrionaceae bacterium]|nr:UvrD-helicase domain-containing protein [Succinivibrionaceae bacterium]
MGKIRMAICGSFIEAMMDLPRKMQKQTKEFIESFPSRCQSGGINYEKINDAACKGYRSARVNDNYRVILNHPDEGNVYLLMWVDSHEEAYRWARRHACEVNPHTDAIQVYETDTSAPAPAPAGRGPGSAGTPIFGVYGEAALLRLGVPEARLPLVLSLTDRDGLSRCQHLLPADSYECLCWLADGEPLDMVMQVYAPPPAAEGGDAWDRSLGSPATRRSFRVIADGADLGEVLEASLEAWRIFLHPEQSRLVHQRRSDSPTLVRGAAGTGKTVVAMHRAVELIRREDWPQGRKLLFTTFTRNLALDLRGLLSRLCTAEEMGRIEVTNLDAWVLRFMRQQGLGQEFAYERGEGYRECWKEALALRPGDLSAAFCHEEFRRVVLPQGIGSAEEYLRAGRRGRGQPLGRRERQGLWPVFARMREALASRSLITFDDACHHCARLLAANPGLCRYGAVVVDEAQDLGEAALRLIASLGQGANPDPLARGAEPRVFLVGDGQQRIYPRVASLRACGLNVRGVRSHRLRVTYRTTEEIRRRAQAVLEGVACSDMDEGVEIQRGAVALRHGEPPVTAALATRDEELRFIAARIQEALALRGRDGGALYQPGDICVAARTNEWAKGYAEGLAGQGIGTTLLGRDSSDDPAGGGVRVATMHRIKGLEFKVVIIAGASSGRVPLEAPPREGDDADRALEDARIERSLFYVAATRARDLLAVTCHGEPGPFLLAMAGGH